MSSAAHGISPTSSSPTSLPYHSESVPSTGIPLHAGASSKSPLVPKDQGQKMVQIGTPARIGGHYEVSEPNFTVTLPCENCSRVIKLYPTDWGDHCTAAMQPKASRIPNERSVTVGTLASSDLDVIISGQTIVYLTIRPPVIALNGHVFTANEAGFYPLGSGSTLVPGGQPVTIDSTVIKMECGGTKIIIGGSTSELQPITMAVTSTAKPDRGSDIWNANGRHTAYPTTGDSMPHFPLSMTYPTSQVTSAGNVLSSVYGGMSDWRAALVLALAGIGIHRYFAV
jgi:hypothetical protein